jgi:heat shock protein HslJ
MVFLVSTAAAILAAGMSSAATPPTGLTGQTWQLAKLGPIDRHQAGITALFTTDGKVSGFAGCNSYSGTYATSGSTISISQKLAATRKSCAALVMAQEGLYLAALGAAKTYSIAQGTLKLKGLGGLQLASFGVQSQALAGTHWRVIQYNNGKQAVTSVMADTKLTAEFGQNTVSGFAGCNDYNAPVKLDPPTIAIGPIASTRKACSSPEGVMDQEAAFLAALGSSATYSQQGRTLELRTAGGALAVVMQRA